MRVMLVSAYSEKSVGGIINWTKHIVNYQRKHKNGIDLVLLNNESAVQVMGDAHPLKRVWYGLKNNLPVVVNFKQKIRNDKIDVVHICSSASYGLLRDLLITNEARRHGIRTCIHMHFGRIPSILQTKGWERMLLMRLMRNVDRVIVMDMASLKTLHEFGFNNVCYLPNPLSSEVQQVINKQGVLVREPRKVVFAGHVGEAKGVFELVKACRSISNIKLMLLGKITSNDVTDRLMHLAGENSEKWLCIQGNKAMEDVIHEMLTCSVFVLPSYTEGFPNVILESMACGCPIVATSVGAIPEMLDIDGNNPCGICVPIKDVNKLRSSILKLIEDKNAASYLGKNAQCRVYDLYEISKVWKRLVEIWRHIILPV